MWFLRQSTAGQQIPLGPFVDTTGAAVTTLTIANTDIKLQKTGATSEVNKNAGGATHIAGGRYYAVLNTVDTDTIGPMRVSVHVTGALAVWVSCCVLHANVYDTIFGSVALSTHTASAVAALVPTAVEIRDEIDTNSVALDNIAALVLDVPTAVEIRQEIDSNSIVSSVVNSIVMTTDVYMTMVQFDGVYWKFNYNALENVTIPYVPSAIEIRQEIDANSTVFDYLINNLNLVKDVTDKLDTTWILDGAVYKFTPNALENAPTGGGGSSLTVQEIVNGVLDEMLSTHNIPGTVGAGILNAGAAGNPLTGIIETAGGGNDELTLKEAMQLMLSFMLGMSTGGGTSTIVFRDINNTRNCITLGVDSVANRLSLTRVTVP